MTSSNVEAQNKKYILLNNLENKHSLLMKSEFMSYYKRKILSKKLPPENRPFGVCKELTTISIGK